MGTKSNPGPFDCYAKAEPDEPMFVLLARDPLGWKTAKKSSKPWRLPKTWSRGKSVEKGDGA
jgi:hypothetical protein